jgi:hypothetical protein
MTKQIEGRATTVAQKSMMIEAIFQSWIKCPDLRFGQLIVNAIRDAENSTKVPLFYMEDYDLEAAIVEFACKNEKT